MILAQNKNYRTYLPQIKKQREMRGREEENFCFSLLSGHLWDLGKMHILALSNLLVL